MRPCRRIRPVASRARLAALLVAALVTGLAPFVPARSAPAPAPVRITDAAGRMVELPRPPRRVVIAGRAPYMTVHLLYMFPGAGERLVGTEEKGKVASDFVPLLDPEFTRKPTLQNPGPEQVAGLHPDLVLLKQDRMDALGTALAEVRVPVAYLGLETPEQFFRDVSNLGALLGEPARARAIDAYYRGRIERIRAGWRSVPEAKRPRVLVAEYGERGGHAAVRVPARPWMQTIQVETAGGRPVWLDSGNAASGWTIVNLEQVARWDPDMIVLVVWYTLDPAKVIAALKDDPQWSALRAVRQGNLRAFPSDIYGWDTPDPRWLLGMTWMAKTLHPDRFAALDVAAEVRDFYRTLYGMDDRAIESGIMSRVRLDVR
jgi:iron complex transport system substrate-binding protein